MTLLKKMRQRELLADHCTFGIGGPARYFVEVKDIEEMREAFLFAKSEGCKVFILGKGSNCLFDDRGFPGLVILNKISFCEIEDCRIHVGSGYSFSLLGTTTAMRGLSGLEFASGIPATVGGAIFMNAGANGGQCSDCLEQVLFLDAEGNLKTYDRSMLLFSYRTSSFQELKGAIISARFCLHPLAESREKQKKILDARMKSQPLKEKSAGCLFRNPSPVTPAGRLIEEMGLKGYQVGGAKVSEKHANFIVNDKGSCQDVLALVAHIRKRVKEEKDIDLELEVRYIPYV